VLVVALSATVSNAEEFGDWLTQVRGGTTVIVDEHRPVPLWPHVLANGRLFDLFVEHGAANSRAANSRAANSRAANSRAANSGAANSGAIQRGRQRAAGPSSAGKVNPELLRLARLEDAGRGARRPARFRLPYRPDVIRRLDVAGLLPAITFIFSRSGCDAAVRQCLDAGIRLTTPEEVAAITEVAERRTADVPESDLPVLGYGEWLTGLQRGIAAHHAGMLPTFKEVVEQLFEAGLVRAVFATETLALGINMPARTVVIERLDKWNGESHVALTPGEYTQLTGRAGRRGIDVEGHAVVLWQPGMNPAAVAGLAGTRTYPLNSSFRPSYNMAVNLVGQAGLDRATAMLESSFAQFQADRAVVGIARQAQRSRQALADITVSCDRGDFAEYARLRKKLSELEGSAARQRSAGRRAEALRSLEGLRRGDIIQVPGGRRAGVAVVLDPGLPSGRRARADRSRRPAEPGDALPLPVVLTANRQVKRLSVADFPGPATVLDRVRIPATFSARSPQHRRDLVSTVRNKLADRGPQRGRDPAPEPSDQADLRRRLRQHPCHACADREDHARQAERYARLEQEVQRLEAAVAGRSHVIARTFGRVCAVLGRLGYLEGDKVTPDGRRLADIYTELDLLAAECLRRELWAGLDPAELTACVSALTFEARKADDAGPPRLPAGAVREVLASMVSVWGELAAVEKENGLAFLREPDLGFAWTAHAWAQGEPLESVLMPDLTPGDFVRAVKQLIDLLGQIAVAAGQAPLGVTARQAAGALRRGVVAYSSVG
jgi:ATP-dependent RNA helicase HelY